MGEEMYIEEVTNGVSDESGVVYILGHSYMPGVVKIGFTSNLADRMRSLDQSSAIPSSFECIFAAKVQNPRLWEKTLHTVFDEARVNSKREFFDVGVMAKAVMILQAAKMEDVTNSAPAVAQTDETPSETTRNSNRRERFNFALLQIDEGELLQFISDESVICMVSQVKPPKVLLDDQEMTLSEATAKASGASRSVSGLAYWKLGNETLIERRARLEKESDGSDDDV